MAVLVILIARHKRALKLFEDQGSQLLNKDRMPPAIADRTVLLPRTYDPDRAGSTTLNEFIDYGGTYELEPSRPNVDGIVVLYEEPLSYLLNGIQNAVFSASIPAIPYVENVQNFLIGHFRLLIGNYGLLVELTSNATKYQAASLPIRNFNAQELRAFIEACRARSLDKTFQNEIVPRLNDLLQRRGPKRRSNYPHVYFKDDAERYFKYGHERHSRYETRAPHTGACRMNGSFRLGWPLEQDRHFNVTVGDSDTKEQITCQLPNCHNEIVHTRSKSHINMFSNDFHA